MPVPTQDNAHVTEGVALLTSHYLNKPVVTGMVRALMARFQVYETAIYQLLTGVVLDNHPLAGGPWGILDKIGSIVLVPRDGMADADYVAAIRLRIRVLRSHGLSEDIIQIAALLTPNGTYWDWFPAAFELRAMPITQVIHDALLANLGEAKSAGTAGYLRSTAVITPFNWITWGSTITGGGIGFSSTRTGTPANSMVSLELLTKVREL